MVIFPLAPDQTIAEMWSNGAQGVDESTRMPGGWLHTEMVYPPTGSQPSKY